MTHDRSQRAAIGVDGLKDRQWDVVVIGAGPAGSLTAYELARRDRSVLLVEKSIFPRWKVCGACLGEAGIRALEGAGLESTLDRVGARRVTRTMFLWKGRYASIAMNRMVAVSRRALDASIAQAAVEAGAESRLGVRAEVWNDRVVLHHDGRAVPVQCRSIVQAGGLQASRRGDGARIARTSWIGLGAIEPADGAQDDCLTMAVGRRGYVGRVVTEDGMANWAAAIDPAFVRRCKGPGHAIASICADAGAERRPPVEGWVGTPFLSRRIAAQEGATYRVGDASGYVEPITGEGMSWALLGAMALAPIIDRALMTGVHGRAWRREHARLMRWRRMRCLAVARVLRSETVMGVSMAMLRQRLPGVDRLINRLIGGTSRWRHA